MKSSICLAPCICVAAALSASCAGSQPPIAAAETSALTSRTGGASPLNYRVLHSFGADRDGNTPNAGLTYDGDAFYGTTSGGGLHGRGTVFSITTGGAETVLHSFGKKFKGLQPYAGLLDIAGTLYGTTPYGGAFGDGTVFSMTRDGSEKVLHCFGKGTMATILPRCYSTWAASFTVRPRREA